MNVSRTADWISIITGVLTTFQIGYALLSKTPSESIVESVSLRIGLATLASTIVLFFYLSVFFRLMKWYLDKGPGRYLSSASRFYKSLRQLGGIALGGTELVLSAYMFPNGVVYICTFVVATVLTWIVVLPNLWRLIDIMRYR